jgi:hypothetical protein
MQYLYEIYDKKTKTRVDTTTRIEDFENNYCDFENYYVVVTDMLAEISVPLYCEDINDWLMWREKLERDAAWKPSRVMGKQPIETALKENPFEIGENPCVGPDIPEIDELPRKGYTYFVEDDGFHTMSMYANKQELEKAAHDVIEKERIERLNKYATRKENEAYLDAINPPHYQEFVQGLQWIEAEFRKPQFRDKPSAIKGALLFQVNKYLSRLGGKDAELQEVEKALWYLKFLAAYMKVGCKPIYVDQVDDILLGKISDPEEGTLF